MPAVAPQAADLERRKKVKIALRRDLDFQVGCRDREFPSGILDQDVRQDWQRMPSFDDSRNGLEGLQEPITRQLF